MFDGGSCVLNETLALERVGALPAYFLRHWPRGSVGMRHMQQTYESLAGWGRTRFQVVGRKLYFPDLAHNTFGCVLRRTPILAWALLETLDRHAVADVDIPVNCRDQPNSPLSRRLRDPRSDHVLPPFAFSYTTAATYADIPLPDYTYWVTRPLAACRWLPAADCPPLTARR